jgi:hypothetical protein
MTSKHSIASPACGGGQGGGGKVWKPWTNPAVTLDGSLDMTAIRLERCLGKHRKMLDDRPQ